jgi:cytochrome c-type biogenesis protein CcsB
MSELIWLMYEVILHWIGIAFYILSTFFFVQAAFFKNGKSIPRAFWCMGFGLVPHSAALLGRWIIQGHGPYMSRYEVISSDAWVAIVFFLCISFRWERINQAGIIVMPVSLLLIAFGMLTDPAMHDLPPSLRSVWLVMHISFAKLAAGAIISSFALAILYLLKEKNSSYSFLSRIPQQDVLDEYSYKFAGFGLIFWTINIAAGSIWADISWGRFWGWDPIETWSFITWLMYGLFAHLRVFWRWRGKKSAYFLIFSFLMSIFTIFVLPFVARSLHTEYFVK